MSTPPDETAGPLPIKLEDAEKRLRRLMDKRNDLNVEAREQAAERDQLNDERRRILATVAELRAQRDAISARLQEHKFRRNENQRLAKELIEAKKGRRAGLAGGHTGRVAALEAEIKAIEWKHNTTPLTPNKEKGLMKELQLKQKELAEVRTLAGDEARVLSDVKDIDQKIDELFRAADSEHADLVKLVHEADALSAQMAPAYAQADTLRSEADKKHQSFVALRERADHFHSRAEELRTHVLGLREAEMAERRESDREMKDRKEAIEKALSDPATVESQVDDVLDRLKRGGRISL